MDHTQPISNIQFAPTTIQVQPSACAYGRRSVRAPAGVGGTTRRLRRQGRLKYGPRHATAIATTTLHSQAANFACPVAVFLPRVNECGIAAPRRSWTSLIPAANKSRWLPFLPSGLWQSTRPENAPHPFLSNLSLWCYRTGWVGAKHQFIKREKEIKASS